MKLFLPMLAALSLLSSLVRADSPKIKVLIVDGQNNHKWAETTPMLKAILEQAGIFSVDVSTTPPSLPKAPPLPKNATPQQKSAHADAVRQFAAAAAAQKPESDSKWAQWRPRFSDYKVVVSNYNGEDWPEEVRTAFVAFVRNGGGFVSYHAADNSFTDWPEYNEMIGLGGWGGRTAKSGPYLRRQTGSWVAQQLPGASGNHGARFQFLVTTEAPDHPIMQGLPAAWMHTEDELYNSLRGPARNVTVLASAVSDVTHEPQPMLMAINYGQGRVFHTTLGHYVEALQGLGFQVTFARGTEWAATGKVTLQAPSPGELLAGPGAPVRALQTVH